MTHSTSLRNREQFETCIGIIRQASIEILLLLDVRVSEGKDPRWFLEQLENARLGLGGWGAVAQRLKLNDAELTQFTMQLRHLQQLVPQYESGQDVSENQLIAALRFVAALEHLRLQQPLLTYPTSTETVNGEAQLKGLSQLRALELMISGLVYAAWPDGVKLRNHLKTQFGQDRVRRWLKLGERNDVLSGMLFSELALMLVDKKEFSRHYAPLFNDSSVLTLFADPRKTLQTLLNDIRQIRNTLTAQKPLSAIQLTMLDTYYPQISAPVQRAFNEGRTTVNPSSLLTTDVDELNGFKARAVKKAGAGGDIFEVGEDIERPERRAVRSPEQRIRLVSGILWGVVGVMVLVIIGGGIMLINSTPPARAVGEPPAQVQVLTNTQNEQETPTSRMQLTRMGITWDESNLRSAIDRNDTRVAQLFLKGGMDWQLSWTEQALSAGNDEVLTLLLRYQRQMVEPRPCRRFTATLSHAMLNGEKLTGQRKDYLRAFCTRSAVVERQRYETEQAKIRNKAQPDESTRQWLAIQTAIYNVIR